MVPKTNNSDQSNVDKSLVAMFLKLSPEERLELNDESACTILELRSAFKKRTVRKHRPELDT
jgi:hypothetical protein